jgi:predicted PurR-regulated permease PerM
MDIKLQIDTKTFVRFWLVVIGFVVAGLLIFLARDALMVIGIALFLALALSVPVAKISKWLPGRSRVGATLLSFLAVLGVLGALIFLVIPPVVQQTAKFAETLPEMVSQVTTRWSGLQGVIDEYNLQPQVDAALQSIQENATNLASNVGRTVVSSIGSFFSAIIVTILVLVLAFLMLIEGPKWMRLFWGTYSDKVRMNKHKKLAEKSYNVVTGYVTGQLTVAAIGAVASGLGVAIISLIVLDIPMNLAIPSAVIAFILALVPMFGSTIAGIIISLLIALTSFPAAIAFAVYYIIYQQIENNFISPYVQAKKINLSALAVLVAVTIGLYMFGLIGGLIAIPIAGMIRVFFDEYFFKPRKLAQEKALAGQPRSDYKSLRETIAEAIQKKQAKAKAKTTKK